MTDRVVRSDLQIDAPMAQFIEDKALPGTGVAAVDFWRGFSSIVHDLGPKNRDFLAKRTEIQAKIDAWHVAHREQPHDASAYRTFLQEIGYLVPEGPDFDIETVNVDPEIAHTPGPQLVVPITNARFALNAANARWGNLYDALYGTDARGDTAKPGPYDPARGARVITWAKRFLDKAVPLDGASWTEVTEIKPGKMLQILPAGLLDPTQYLGHAFVDGWTCILLENNGLGIEILLNAEALLAGVDLST